MADSPLATAEGVLRVTVTSNGTALTEGTAIRSVTVRRALNKVPTATLVMSDGDMPSESFPLSTSETFVPGAEVSIKAGYNDQETEVFKGIVVRHSLRIDGENDARLIIECRDPAIKMTVGRKSAQYENQKDSDVISTLIGASSGLTASVTATTEEHKSLIQHYCTDWDFLMARAEAVGHVVVVTDGTVKVGPPSTDGEPVLQVTYGVDLMEVQADLDARDQYATVKAQAWDPATQALITSADAAPATLNAQGDITQATLAAVLDKGTITLQTGAPWTQVTLDSWAKAQQLKSGLSRLRGRMKFQGSALAAVDQLIELVGIGGRFDGKVYVSSLTHTMEDGNWYSDVDFGMPVEWFTERADIEAPSAAGLVPGIQGLHAGVVLKLDGDPLSQQRIQVKVPSASIDKVWARLLQLHASNSFGSFFLPEVGDEVLLGWFNDDPDFPVILGSLYSSKQKPPYELAAENNTKAIVTRCKSKLEFDEDKKVITITTPGANKMVLSDDAKSIVISDQTGNKVELTESGITLDSPKDILIKAKGKITLDAVGDIEGTSKADVKLAGLNVNCTAKVGFVAKGSASAELSASGQTTVKGAMVMIN